MKRSLLKKHSKNKISVLKRKAWKLFSVFIRQRGMDKESGFNKCYCCGKKYHWKQLQAGHFVSRQNNSTLYDPMNVQPACYACNIWRYGNLAEFAGHLIKDYGLEEFNKLVKRGREMKQFKEVELFDVIKKYSL